MGTSVSNVAQTEAPLKVLVFTNNCNDMYSDCSASLTDIEASAMTLSDCCARFFYHCANNDESCNLECS